MLMKKIMWIVYFGFMAIMLLTLLGSSGIRLVDFFFSCIALTCLWLYVISDKLLYLPFWKVYLYFFIIWELIFNYIVSKESPDSSLTDTVSSLLMTLVLLMPLARAMYLYSYKKKTLSSSASETKTGSRKKNYDWVLHALGVLFLLASLGNITNKDNAFGFKPPVNDYAKGENAGAAAAYTGALWYVYFLYQENKKTKHENTI